MSLNLASFVAGIGGSLIERLFPDPVEASRARARLLELERSGELSELGMRMQGLGQELSGNVLQRSWRPVLMYSIIAILVNNFLLAPYLTAFGLHGLVLEFPESLWRLLNIGVGGYVVGRSGEKIMQNWRK